MSTPNRLLVLCFAGLLSGAAGHEDVAFFERIHQTKIEGVSPIDSYPDPDQFYTAIAKQLDIPRIAFEATAKELDWKEDGEKVSQAMVKRPEGGPWQVMVFRFSIDKELKKADVQTLEMAMVEVHDDGTTKIVEDAKASDGPKSKSKRITLSKKRPEFKDEGLHVRIEDGTAFVNGEAKTKFHGEKISFTYTKGKPESVRFLQHES